MEIKTPELTPEVTTERISIVRNSKQRENESNASYLIRKVLEKSENVETAETYFEVLLKHANEPNSFGRIFTENEIGQAFVECMEILNPNIPDETVIDHKGKGKGKGKSSKKGKPNKGKTSNRKPAITEHHGVMFMYKKELEKSRIWFKQISGRLAQICFKTKGPNMVITNTLAPHTWLSGDRSKDDMLEIRQEFFNHYTDILLDHKEKCLHIAVGDFNTRIHARCSGEENVLGPFVWGRGETFVKKLTPLDREQRGVLIATLKASEHIHMNSFFEKSDDKKVHTLGLVSRRAPIHPNEIRRARCNNR